jgi:hypothetical protein
LQSRRQGTEASVPTRSGAMPLLIGAERVFKERGRVVGQQLSILKFRVSHPSPSAAPYWHGEGCIGLLVHNSLEFRFSPLWFVRLRNIVEAVGRWVFRFPRCQRANGPGDCGSCSACASVHPCLYQDGARISRGVFEPLEKFFGSCCGCHHSAPIPLVP